MKKEELRGRGKEGICSASTKRYHFDPPGLHNLQRRPAAKRLAQTPAVVEVPVLVQDPLVFQGVSDLLLHNLLFF